MLDRPVEVSAFNRERAWEEVTAGMTSEIVRLRAENLAMQDLVVTLTRRIEELERDDVDAV
jgi:hypothetical protein